MGIGQFHNRRVSKKYFQIGIFQKKIIRLRPHVEDNHFIEVFLLGLPGNPYFSLNFGKTRWKFQRLKFSIDILNRRERRNLFWKNNFPFIS